MTVWTGRFQQQQTAATLAVYGTICHLCGQDGATTADHIVPRSRGGGHSLANLRPAHVECNRARGVLPLPVWFARHPLPARPALTPSRNW